MLDKMTSPWDAHASVYERVWEASTLLWGRDALTLVPASSSCLRLLDVACGAGALAIEAASKGYNVTAIDQSSAMIARLQAKADAKSNLQLYARVGDGQTLDGLPNESFDVMISNFGIFLFPDRLTAWESVRRVLVPGGTVVATSWDVNNFNVRMIQYLIEHAKDQEETPTETKEPVLNRMMSASSFRDELAECGFDNIRIQTISHTMHFTSGEELVTGVLDNASFVALFGHKDHASLQRCILDFVQLEVSSNVPTTHEIEVDAKRHQLWSVPIALKSVAHVGVASKPRKWKDQQDLSGDVLQALVSSVANVSDRV